MRSESRLSRARFARAGILLMGAASATCQAQANPFERGPDPTSSLLNASAGPLATASVAVSSPTGFGGGTIYYPTEANTYGVIAFCPGFTSSQKSVAWLGSRLASHGFVVVTLNTNSTLDFPSSRATQLMAALNHVINNSSSTVKSRIDPNRLAVGGHSMGGGGSLIAAQKNPSLKGAYPLAPWNLSTTFSNVSVPTMIIGSDGDTTALVALHARPFYASLPAAAFKAYGELNGAKHSTTTSTNIPTGRYAVSWMKRFVDADTRYSAFLCGAEHTSYATAEVFDHYRQNCPY